MNRACWRDLRRYKYQLTNNYTITIPITPDSDIPTGFATLTSEGILHIRKHYAWDGPSGITIDTKSFMRGSLVHGALYQLMSLGKLDYEIHRETADQILKDICIEDGMWKFRAAYVHWAVRIFGEKHARPTDEPIDEITCMPAVS